jgi:hypothetical protein
VSIPVIQSRVLRYFESFDLAAVAVTRDNRLLVTRNPAGCDAAWGARRPTSARCSSARAPIAATS